METKVIIKGIKWAAIEYAFNTVFRFLVKLILAKLLMPADFGLVGMASIFIAVASAASELGMSAALIQKKTDEEATPLYNTAFWSGLALGAVFFLIMSLLVTPFAASFYNEPILKKLIPVLCIGILVNPLNLIHNVILVRSMNFKNVASVNNLSALMAGIAGLIAALAGTGVWALAIYNTLSVVLSVPLFYSRTKWKPGMEWKWRYFTRIFRFGIFSTGTSVFSTITYNIDNLMIGKIIGSSALGAYTLAFSLTEILRQAISSIINKVMYPVFGKEQNNTLILKTYFLKIVNINAIVMYPIMMYLFLFADNLIPFIFGEKWTDAVVPLQILSLAIMVHLIINSFASLLRGLGFPEIEFKIILTTTLLVLIPSLYFGITNWGLIGAASAIFVNKIALGIISIAVLNKHIHLKIKELVHELRSPVISLLLVSPLVLLFRSTLPFEMLTFLYWLGYSGMIYLMEKKKIREILKRINE